MRALTCGCASAGVWRLLAPGVRRSWLRVGLCSRTVSGTACCWCTQSPAVAACCRCTTSQNVTASVAQLLLRPE
eukprot:scaffold42458_cov68-Phaeocystis_antarctica.AAC.5